MVRIIRTIAAIILVALLYVPDATAAGQFFPDSRVTARLTGIQAAYLGLADGSESFRFSDIKTEFLLINIFSLYCSPCQRDANDFNEMYEEVAKLGLEGRMKFIGVGAGNTEREIDHWRELFNVQFPLVSDEDYILHTAVGSVGTPFYVLARVDGPDQLHILFAQEGAFKDKDAFFATILAHAGMDVAPYN